MQLVKTTRDTLLRPLQIVSGIVERRHTMPILANILIRKDGESVSFLSTDTEVQITTHADIGSGHEVTGTTVAARKLLDILRALPESGDVTMTLLNKRLTVQTGKSRFALQTLAAEEFPTVQQADNFSATVTLPQKTLKHLFNMVHFSMAQQDIRYYLNGLLLVLDGNHVIAVATDGHRLAFCQVATEQTFARQEVIIPRKTIVGPVSEITVASNLKTMFATLEPASDLELRTGVDSPTLLIPAMTVDSA
ncbi:MAG: DNA polymerase III subunit beta [Sphingomonadaceae bacterium]